MYFDFHTFGGLLSHSVLFCWFIVCVNYEYNFLFLCYSFCIQQNTKEVLPIKIGILLESISWKKITTIQLKYPRQRQIQRLLKSALLAYKQMLIQRESILNQSQCSPRYYVMHDLIFDIVVYFSVAITLWLSMKRVEINNDYEKYNWS